MNSARIVFVGTAVDVGKVSQYGFKTNNGAIERFDKDTETLVVKSADRIERTFEVAGRELNDASKATGEVSLKVRKLPCITPKRVAKRPRTTCGLLTDGTKGQAAEILSTSSPKRGSIWTPMA
jgi:hypothetical protein